MLILSLFAILLVGCWDFSEVEDVSVASTIAIDIDKNTGEYILNIEVTDVEGTKQGINLIPIVVETRGKTIEDAARNMISITSKTPYWGHTNIIIISEDLAKRGISPPLDWIGRNPEVRLSTNIFVSKGKTAKEILYDKQEFTKIRTFEYERLQNSYELLSKLPIIRASRVINQVQQSELYAVLPTVELVDIDSKTASNSIGSAHFKRGKLVGYLNPLDTMKYLFVQDEVKKGILIIPLGKDRKVSLNIYKNKTHIKFDFKDEKLSVHVNIKSLVDIAEIDGEFDYTTIDGIELLKKKSDKYLEKEIETFIKDFQKDIGNDIFAFGNKLKKRHPELWKSVEKNWDDIFSELDVVVNSDIKIKGSQNIGKPIKIK